MNKERSKRPEAVCGSGRQSGIFFFFLLFFFVFFFPFFPGLFFPFSDPYLSMYLSSSSGKTKRTEHCVAFEQSAGAGTRVSTPVT